MSSENDPRVYPMSFRLKVLKEIENGLLTKEGARRKYGIKGKCTVLKWIRKYCNKNWEIKVKEKQKKLTEEEKRIAELEAKNRLLEDRLIVYEGIFDIVKEEDGVDLKKNFGAEALSEVKKKKKEGQ